MGSHVFVIDHSLVYPLVPIVIPKNACNAIPILGTVYLLLRFKKTTYKLNAPILNEYQHKVVLDHLMTT